MKKIKTVFLGLILVIPFFASFATPTINESINWMNEKLKDHNVWSKDGVLFKEASLTYICDISLENKKCDISLFEYGYLKGFLVKIEENFFNLSDLDFNLPKEEYCKPDSLGRDTILNLLARNGQELIRVIATLAPGAIEEISSNRVDLTFATEDLCFQFLNEFKTVASQCSQAPNPAFF